MFKEIARPVGLLLLIALTGVSLPVQAQSFNFGFRFGDEQRDYYPQRASCLTDRQIREAIAGRGYSDIFLNAPDRQRIQVRATRDGWVYLLDFDFCRNRIRGATELRPAR